MKIKELLIKIGKLLSLIFYFGISLFAIIGGFISMVYLLSINDGNAMASMLPIAVGIGMIYLWKLGEEDEKKKTVKSKPKNNDLIYVDDLEEVEVVDLIKVKFKDK